MLFYLALVANPGGPGLEPFFTFIWKINAIEWGHIVGTPLYRGLGSPYPTLINDKIHPASCESNYLFRLLIFFCLAVMN